MNFNPLFLQNTSGVDNTHPEKTNKLSGSGYLFSDIINVFMNTDETDSVAKLTQEFLGSAQLKESNGTPVILSLLGETTIPLADATKNLQLKIEDFLPAGLKKKLVLVEGENNKNISEKDLTANQNQLSQILETINNLFKIAKSAENSDSNKNMLDVSETTELLNKTDGVFLIVETADKIFNINISKQPGGKDADLNNESGNAESLYKIKFTVVNENSLLSSQGNNTLAVNNGQNNSQINYLPFNSELIEGSEKNTPVINLKVFTYQNSGSENVLANSAKDNHSFTDNKLNAGINSNPDKNAPVQITNNENDVKLDAEEVVAQQKGNGKNSAASTLLTKATSNLTGEVNSENAKSLNTNKSEQNNSINTKAENTAKNINPTDDEIISKLNKNVNSSTKQINDDLNGAKNNAKAEGLLNNKLTDETNSSLKTQTKEVSTSLDMNKLKDAADSNAEVKKNIDFNAGQTHSQKQSKNVAVDDNLKNIEKPTAENKENEQINIKVAKAVKNITTVKPEANSNISEKPVKENSEAKTVKTEEKAANIQSSDSSNKNYSQNENSFKHSDENKNVPIESNRISTNEVKEKFTLESPTPHSNSERIVKAAEIMKEISRFIQKQENSSLTLRISPEELGKVKITMDISEQSVRANIHVENEAVKTIVEKNIAELQNQMSKNGLQLTSVNVMLSDTEQKATKHFANKKKSNSFEMNDKNVDEVDEEKVKMMGYNTIEYLA